MDIKKLIVEYIINNLNGLTIILLVIFVLSAIFTIIYIIKLEKRNFKLRRKFSKDRDAFNVVKIENEDLKFKKTLSDEMINQLKKDNYKLLKLNDSLNKEIIELKNEISLNKSRNNEIKVSSTVFVPDTKQIVSSNNEDLQDTNLDENVLCNNLFLFESEKKCWRCQQITKVVCLGTSDSYTLFENTNHYERYQHMQLLSYVTKVPEHLASFLKTNFRYYPSRSNKAKKEYYINHCEHCGSIQGDNYIHEVPEEAIYKHLCYKNSDKANYYVFKNEAVVPIQAQLPYYDSVAGSFDLVMNHMFTEKENRASLNITQKLIDKLIDDSNFCGSIEIEYL